MSRKLQLSGNNPTSLKNGLRQGLPSTPRIQSVSATPRSVNQKRIRPVPPPPLEIFPNDSTEIKTTTPPASTLHDVFWPSDGPNFSVLPGVGGMYVKGFGLIRGPPPSAGIPIYYFHPLQPPPFESGKRINEISSSYRLLDRMAIIVMLQVFTQEKSLLLKVVSGAHRGMMSLAAVTWDHRDMAMTRDPQSLSLQAIPAVSYGSLQRLKRQANHGYHYRKLRRVCGIFRLTSDDFILQKA